MTALTDMQDYAKVLLYGPQGTGKTTAMASLAHLGKVIYIDAESGLKRRPLLEHGIPIDNIEVEKPRAYDEYQDLYWKIKGRIDDGEPIVGVALDSYTEIQAQLVLGAQAKRLAKLEAGGKEVDYDFIDRDDYGVWTTQARRLTRMWRDLDCHVVFGALQRRDTSSGSLELLPDLTEKFRNDLMGYVDMIGATVTAESPYALDAEGIEYLGIFRKVKMYSGKDRFKVTPVVMTNPHMHRLVGLLDETLDLESDAAQLAYYKRMGEVNTEPDDDKDGDANDVRQ